jgi:hypothetical protein
VRFCLRDRNVLGDGDTVCPKVSLECRAGSKVGIGLGACRPCSREGGYFGMIVSADGVDEIGRRLRRPQALRAQQVKMPFAGAQGTPIRQGFLQGTAHLNWQFLIRPIGVTFQRAVGLGRHAVVHAGLLSAGRPQGNRSA